MQGVNGTAVSTTVIGIQDVGAGGKASATTIATDGLRNVFSGGTVSRTIARRPRKSCPAARS